MKKFFAILFITAAVAFISTSCFSNCKHLVTYKVNYHEHPITYRQVFTNTPCVIKKGDRYYLLDGADRTVKESLCTIEIIKDEPIK